ncbi:guanine nucleotide exchange factor subunit Rich-like isoform X2 [Schistocerca gregaria]|nr:guanine nucleotide exchange factor subunit Rich-like isoform X2 [Schistocerca gregaria]
MIKLRSLMDESDGEGFFEGAHYIKEKFRCQVKLSLDRVFLASGNRIAWLFEKNSSFYLCTCNGILQSWSMAKDKHPLKWETSVAFIARTAQTNTEILTCQEEKRQNSSANTCQVQETESSEYQCEKEGDIEGHVRKVAYSHQSGLMMLVLKGGKVAALKGDLTNGFKYLKFFWLFTENAVDVAISSHKKLIAIGYLSGDVDLYNFDFKFERRLSLGPWGIKQVDSGQVSCLAWSHDENALAVGYLTRGFSIWSNYGCRLNCTISQMNVILEHSRDDRANEEQAQSVESNAPNMTKIESMLKPEAARHGLTHIVWGPEGYHILTASRVNVLDQYAVVKASVAANSGINECRRILLQGEDSVLLLQNYGKGASRLHWKRLVVPSAFVHDNWPVMSVCTNTRGDYLAVSGHRGVSICNVQTGSWKLFWDVSEERQLEDVVMTWFDSFLVVANYCGKKRTTEIFFFCQSRPLAFGQAAFRERYTNQSRPVCLVCSGSNLMLQTEETCTQYEVVEAHERGRTISLRQIYGVRMSEGWSRPRLVCLLPTGVKVLFEKKERCAKFNNRGSTAKLVELDKAGAMYLTDAERSTKLELSRSVEQFWLMEEGIEGSDCMLWVYGEAGLDVWYPFLSSSNDGPELFLSHWRRMEFDHEVCPLGFLADSGTIIGISQHQVHLSMVDTPHFELQLKVQPYLHYVLLSMLEGGDFSTAQWLAERYRLSPLFNRFLELLLHEALQIQCSLERKSSKSSLAQDRGGKLVEEDRKGDSGRYIEEDDGEKSEASVRPLNDAAAEREPSLIWRALSSSRKKSSPMLLKDVLSFLKMFEEIVYMSTIVACARKSDPESWSVLFDPKFGCSNPKVYFEKSLELENISVAMSYLRVIQLLESPEDFYQSGLKCLEFCLRTNDKKLGQLMRFLKPYMICKNDEGDQLGDAELDASSRFLPLQEKLLLEHAENLMTNFQFRRLIDYARTVGHDLRTWLIQKKDLLNSKEEDYESILSQLHTQFDVPRPTHFPLNYLLHNAGSGNNLVDYSIIYFPNSNYLIEKPHKPQGGSHGFSLEKSNLADVYAQMEESNVVRSFQDLEVLLRETLASGCTVWALILATILFRLPVIIKILGRHPEYLQKYREMIQMDDSNGYTELLAYIEQQL